MKIKINLQLILMLSIAFFFIQCNKEDINSDNSDGSNTAIVYGKTKVITKIDGDDREYFVHIPKSYTGKGEVPMVFMLHGTGGNGEEFWDRSGWKEVGETENIITLFPTSWQYCIHTNGETRPTTKWNTPPDAEWTFCVGQNPRNDIKFLSTIISEMSAKYKINLKRIYVAGFSNGGQMAAKCTIELSDKLAAVVQSASSFYIDTVYIPKRRQLPILLQIGNEDYGPDTTGPAIPMNQFSYLISTPGLEYKKGSFYTRALDHIRNFNLNPSFTISGDTSKVSIATYKPMDGNTKYEFQYVLIKGLAHAYPNGTNHPLESAKLNWAWMKNFSL